MVRVVSVGPSVWWVFPWWWRFRGARSWLRVWGVPVVALVAVVGFLVGLVVVGVPVVVLVAFVVACALRC